MTGRRAPNGRRLLGQVAEALSRPAAHLLIERGLGVRTAGRLSLADLGASATGRENYSPASWPTLRRGLRGRGVRPGDVFLDLGAGKGRMLVLAARYPFARVVGVEVSSALAEAAVLNLERARPLLRCRRAEVVAADAARHPVPDEVTVAHMFNPFTGEVFAEALDRLLESIGRAPRQIRLIYTNPRRPEHELVMASGHVADARQIQPLTLLGNRLGDMAVCAYDLVPEAGSGGQRPLAPGKSPRGQPRGGPVEASAKASTEQIEQEIQELLDQESFDPPEEFAGNALISDESAYEEAAEDPVGWWEKQADALHWFSRWEQALDDSNAPFYKWFSGGKINASYNCLDRHVEDGKGDKVAFHWRGEEGEERDVTYAELLRDTQKLANALKDRGIEKGDVVGIFLPMIPEVVVAMLACARIGAPHNLVFGGFSADSVKERMEFSEAKALITTNHARRKGKSAEIKSSVDEFLDDVPSIETVVVVRNTDEDAPMKDGRDVWYHEALEQADDECPAEELDAEHPLYVLYTSGSTAKPKGILHTTGGYLTGIAWTTRHVFDLKPDEDVFWCSADVGWVTGHSYIVYGPMTCGATSVMYEGAPDYPDKDIWWELCDRYDVTVFYTAPTAIRACIKWGVEHPQKHDLSKLRLLGTVGEPINPKAWLWYRKVIGGDRCPIVDTWWQTETGHIMISPLPGVVPTKPGSATRPLPGVEAAVLTEEGEDAGTEQGLLALKRPWPGMLRTLFKDDDRFKETYFSKWDETTYFVGDAARKDEDGYFWIIGRVDDVINVSGHRLSTAEVESAIVSHSKVAESAVIGQQDEDTGQAICAFVTLEGDLEGSEELIGEIREQCAKRIGKLARPKRVIWADDLPKTRSGKIMRRLLRDIAEGRELGDVTTLRDPDVMQQLEGRVKELQSEED